MSTFISRGSGREGDLLLAALNQSFQEQGDTFQVLCCVRVSRCPLAVVVERKGESCRVIRVRVVEVAAELDGAIMVIVVVGVGAFQLGPGTQSRLTTQEQEGRLFSGAARACESRGRREAKMINIYAGYDVW